MMVPAFINSTYRPVTETSMPVAVAQIKSGITDAKFRIPGFAMI